MNMLVTSGPYCEKGWDLSGCVYRMIVQNHVNDSLEGVMFDRPLEHHKEMYETMAAKIFLHSRTPKIQQPVKEKPLTACDVYFSALLLLQYTGHLSPCVYAGMHRRNI